ncbi:MAG TPA: hypothetical protein VD833_21240 [Vicinamibacterales bacterium]|nr:hypothetical protein [Vicinamibacterales bacterium]
MITRLKRPRRLVAAVAVFTLLVPPSSALLARQQQPAAKPPASPAPAQPATAKPAATPASAATPAVVDGGWPRIYDTKSGGSILVYQPQIASWEGQKHMVGYAAVSYRAKAADKPALGTIRLESDTSVSLSERLVRFAPMKITEVNFQTIPKDQVREVVAQIEEAIPDDDRLIALDRVLANLDKSRIMPKNVDGIKADPPAIFFSKTPAVIVNLDGEPIWSPIKENDLKFAVNTNWDLFQHTPTSTYYLRHNDSWLKATDLKGAWSPAGKLPESFAKLPAEENWKEVKSTLPGKPLKTAPKVFVSLQPGELILLTGEPSYLLVPGTNLLWVRNTESDVFRLGKTGAVYYLVAGRWFSAPDFTGPWTFATPSLPEDFKKIPLEHDRSRVLASVPGTDQAAEAVLLAQIPQTARVNKKELKAPDVAFQGDPQFAPIEKTTVQRAVNTDKDVFKVGELYYMCYQGVWFVGKSGSGPWEVAESVPSQIYEIPVSSPAHHVTYVTIEEDDDDDWVVYAAAAGYTGMMIGWGCTMWGTGWYYPPYWGYGAYYPYYYPHFPTYGYSAWYNPWTGAYGRSAVAYGPYGGAGVGARYNPRTGTYARGAAAWGPYGARGVAQAYNPRTGTYAATRQGSSVYGSWGSTAVQRGDDWAVTNRYTNRRTGTTTRTVRTDEGSAVTRRGAGGGAVGVGEGGNVYAGRDGNVYRREDGTWQKYDNGSWSNTDRQPSERPTPRDSAATAGTRDRSTVDRSTTDQLNRDSAARREGTQRTRDYGSYRSAPTTRSAGSYRGGGMRGGGRRR